AFPPKGQSILQRKRHFAALGGAEKRADRDRLAVRGKREMIRGLVALFEHDARPERLEPPALSPAIDIDPFQGQLVFGQTQMLALPRAAIAEAEREIDQANIEAEKRRHRPGAAQHEGDADAET